MRILKWCWAHKNLSYIIAVFVAGLIMGLTGNKAVISGSYWIGVGQIFPIYVLVVWGCGVIVRRCNAK